MCEDDVLFGYRLRLFTLAARSASGRRVARSESTTPPTTAGSPGRPASALRRCASESAGSRACPIRAFREFGRKFQKRLAGERHRRIIEEWDAGRTSQTAIARRLGISQALSRSCSGATAARSVGASAQTSIAGGVGRMTCETPRNASEVADGSRR
jgi:hypothetical protein